MYCLEISIRIKNHIYWLNFDTVYLECIYKIGKSYYKITYKYLQNTENGKACVSLYKHCMCLSNSVSSLFV